MFDIESFVGRSLMVGGAMAPMADAGSLVNATGNYVNAYTGATTAFTPGSDDLTPGMKTYYDTELLENARDKMIYAQLGRKQSLPAHHGKTVEWRKWNTLPDVDQLTEAVIPEGKKFGQTAINVTVTQYGEYVATSDQLETHYVDNVILGATEELGAAGTRSNEKLVRNALMACTNVMFADVYNSSDEYVSTPATQAELGTALATSGNKAYLTPDMVNKAVTDLKKKNAPFLRGNKYVCVLHPSCTYDLRSHKDWIDAHKYASAEEIFNGEIGELHGVRFVESNLAPIYQITTSGSNKTNVYGVMFFGKDAFAVIDPESMGMETIIKTRREAGGPLNQFSTIGIKFETATKILYNDRMLYMVCNSSYSNTDTANTTV